MGGRNCRLEVRLSKSEMNEVSKKARKAGLSNSSFVRRALKETQVKEAPPADLHILIMEIRRVGANIDQILKKVNGLGFVDVPMLRRELANLAEVEKTIINTYSMVED